MNSILTNKIKKTAITLGTVLVWLAVWEIAAQIVDHVYFLPSVGQTLNSLLSIISSKGFFKRIIFTLLRVISGLVIGIIAGATLAALSYRFPIVKAILSPIISVIKSTPVASLIIIVWVLMDGNSLAVLIAFMMVMPIIWQNLLDGFDSISKDLSELCDAFGFSFIKRFKLLIFPALMKYFIPAIITATGLAWKSEIAAEIIVNTITSIGQSINEAKSNFDTPTVFAWTLIVIIFSITLEKITKSLLNRYKER